MGNGTGWRGSQEHTQGIQRGRLLPWRTLPGFLVAAAGGEELETGKLAQMVWKCSKVVGLWGTRGGWGGSPNAEGVSVLRGSWWVLVSGTLLCGRERKGESVSWANQGQQAREP